ncbi:MAG TPA: tRNA lysidine(34) synthetase TilS [Anaerolineales bacterium]|nr:tRNA lysidine(34) synthetase TilS [Anaerolineales bacterium]
MLENIESILRDQCRLDRSKPILVGVSGGPDSLCLLEALRQAGYPLVVAHFNHKLRPSADAEAAAVEAIAGRWAIPFVLGSAEVSIFAEANSLSLEEAARHLRYRFLFAQARRLDAQALAVGHTADDQVETVLMHLIRGTGLTGLKGMSYRTILATFDPDIPVVRPLLDTWREETVAYCAARGLQPQYDPSNDSLNFLRNRLRNILIPTLETYNPKFREALWRTVQLLRADHAILQEAIQANWNRSLILQAEAYVMLDLSFLSKCAPGLQRHIIRRAVDCLQPGQETVFSVLERASAFLADPARVRMDLTGGLTLFREGDALYVARPGAELSFDRWPQMPSQKDSLGVSVPGQLDLSGGWKFSAEQWRLPALAWEQSSRNQDLFQVWLDAEDLPDPLELRVRREGDLFEPLGLKGHWQKLSDFFTNEKLPPRARPRWPLLCAAERIVWVPGFRPAESFKLRRSSRKVMYFSITRPRELSEQTR